MSVLISSHNLRELEGICDTIGIMDSGKMILEKKIEDMETEVFKVQVSFEDGMPNELKKDLEIMHEEKLGSLDMLVIKGLEKEIFEKIKEFNPILLDSLNLTLEERFIYEVGGIGYDIEEIIL